MAIDFESENHLNCWLNINSVPADRARYSRKGWNDWFGRVDLICSGRLKHENSLVLHHALRSWKHTRTTVVVPFCLITGINVWLFWSEIENSPSYNRTMKKAYIWTSIPFIAKGRKENIFWSNNKYLSHRSFSNTVVGIQFCLVLIQGCYCRQVWKQEQKLLWFIQVVGSENEIQRRVFWSEICLRLSCQKTRRHNPPKRLKRFSWVLT